MDLRAEIAAATRAMDAGDDQATMAVLAPLIRDHPTVGEVSWLVGRYFGLHEAYAQAAENYEKAVGLNAALSGVEFKVRGHVIRLVDVPGSPWAARILGELGRNMYGLTELRFQPGDTAIDVGAHIGTISVILAKLHPEIRIVAYEPIPSNFHQLTENLARNGICTVVAVNQAVTGAGGALEMMWSAGDTAAASGHFGEEMNAVRTAQGWTRASVDSVTLDAVFARHAIERCAWLKLDCEGAEHDIIRSSQVLDSIDRISVELHIPVEDFSAKGYDQCVSEFRQPLDRLAHPPSLDIVSVVVLRTT